MKEALTTGEIAKHCGVNFRTVIRWIEKGYIEAYKLPGRGDNRVTVDSFLKFLKSNNMPVPVEFEQADTTLPASAEASGKPSRQKNKVLVIEDEELMAKSIKRSVLRAGYEVEVAANGIEAGIMLERFRPDLITLDLQMPGMSGFDVLEALRANESYKGIKVLVVSAATKVKMLEVMDLGVDDILEKPFKSEDLVSRLRVLIAKK
jgi:two-component system, OmpR family, response regulator VicR